MNLGERQQDFEYILSVDSSDPRLEEYKKDNPEFPFSPFFTIVNDNKSMVQAANAAAKKSTGDILILISDDFECFYEWNRIIIKALDGKSGVLKTFDGVQRWICTLPVMTKDYYQDQGYFYYPSYVHMFCDSDMTHKADLQKKLVMRNDIVFKHNHYSVGGHKDVISVKADSTWNQGEAVYLQRCMNRFGLGDIDIYDLSPEAKQAGHVAWLRKKLR